MLLMLLSISIHDLGIGVLVRLVIVHVLVQQGYWFVNLSK